MAKVEEALEILMKLEHGNVEKALHKNSTETGYTYKGIYQTAWPDWSGWNYVLDGLNQCDGDMKKASVYLEQYETLQGLVVSFYKEYFWDRAKLDQVFSQKVANEVFIFGVNVGMRTAIRKLQKLVGTTADGLIGPASLELINAYPEDKFDFDFDEVEKQYYDDIIEKKPYLKIYKNGWYNRAEHV